MKKFFPMFALLIILILVTNTTLARVVLTDEFTDEDYTNNPTWAVISGSFAADGSSVPNLNPLPKRLNFGTAAGTAIKLDLPAVTAGHTSMQLKLRLSTSNVGTSNHKFNITLTDETANNYYKINCTLNPAYFGTSGFALYDNAGLLSVGTSGLSLNTSVQSQLIQINFDPAFGITVYKDDVQIASYANTANLNQIDTLTLENVTGVISWFVDGVEVDYPLELQKTISDNFDDEDYNLNPTWSVTSGQFSCNGSSVSNYLPRVGQLNFGTATGTAIDLTVPSMEADTAIRVGLKLRQSNGTSGNYLFNIFLTDTAGKYYQISCSPSQSYFGSTSGFAIFNSETGLSDIGVSGSKLNNDTSFQTLEIKFASSTGLTVSQNGSQVLNCTNLGQLTRIDRITLENTSGTVSWFVDGVEVDYIPTIPLAATKMQQAQYNEEKLQSTFQRGMWYAGTLKGDFVREFASWEDHNLNQAVLSQLGTEHWNSALDAAIDNNINVITGFWNNFVTGDPLPWNDHTALHTSVANRLDNVNLDASSLQGFYLFDEPNGDDAGNIANLRQTLFEEDPAHSAFSVVIGWESRMKPCYEEVLPYDVLLIDPYGAGCGKQEGNFSDIYYLNEDFIDYIDRATSYIHPLDDTPLWVVIQTTLADNFLRLPTANEIRAMSWLAIAHGAKGLQYFIWQSYSSWGSGLKDCPDEYDMVASVSKDMRDMEDYLVHLSSITNIATINGGGSEVLSAPLMQDDNFWLLGDATRVDDPDASDLFSAHMTNADAAWKIQWHYGKPYFAVGQSYTLYARIKVDKKANSGDAFTIGIWNPTTATYPIIKTVAASEMANMIYQDIEVGSYIPSATQGEYIFVRSTTNSNNVPDIYVDKMWFSGPNVQAYANGDVQTFIMDGPMRTDDINLYAQESSFSLWNDATVISDWDASNGEAAKMKNDSNGWNVQWNWGADSNFTPGKEYELWARIKVTHATASPAGNAFRVAVWDRSNSSYPASRTIAASETIDGEYTNVRVGSFLPRANQIVYVAATTNADISYIYVDKFWFIGRQTAQDDNFTLFSPAIKVSDSDASDGSCALMGNNTTAWGIQWNWGNRLCFDPKLNYDLYAVVKVDHVVSGFSGATGDAFKFGVYDNGSSTYIVPETNVPVKISKDQVYRTYHIGTFKPQADQKVYIAGTDNALNVSGIYVDKFFFIPQGDNYLIAVNHNVNNSDSLTVSFPASSVDHYGSGNITAIDVLTGNNLTLSGTSTLSFTKNNVEPGGGVVVRLKSKP